MKKKCSIVFLLTAAIAVGTACRPAPADDTTALPPAGQLPGQTGKAAVTLEHFPSRVHAFIWRNWGLVPQERLAEVLQTTVQNVRKTAADMGLERTPETDPVWLSPKGYITVLRRNWHLLPYEQILQLLDLTQEELEWRLYEDDFLFVKLGNIKPACAPLYWEKPTARMKKECREIAALAKAHRAHNPVPRFDFFRDIPPQDQARMTRPGKAPEGLRMAFSYCAEYGDPLMDPNQESYSDELLGQLAAQGINAVWVHSVLRMLVEPSGPFPGDKDYRTRRKHLQTLVDRAAKHGIRVMLYVNEPRALPQRWFDTPERKQFAGVTEKELQALCTSDPRVLQWLTDSFRSLFEDVSGLGGVFTITMSENLTNCASHNHAEQCPRCASRPYEAIIAEVNNAIAEGVLTGNPDARVLVWDWKWNDALTGKIIDRLDKRCTLMCVSEWSLPIDRGGISSNVSEYSISAVGPGPWATGHWALAAKAGMKKAAKVMVNNTWELGSIPVIPAMDLIARHAQQLAGLGVTDAMMTWSLGGYPSVNYAVFQRILSGEALGTDDLDPVLRKMAEEYYGKQSGPAVRAAWKVFSEGFSEYPYYIGTLYRGPQHMGPANLFYRQPSGWKSTMVGIPYDDLTSWRSIYPADVYIGQNRKVAEAFARGADILDKALSQETDPAVRQKLAVDLRRAQAIKCHFRAIVNQSAFILHRDAGDTAGMKQALDEELENVCEYLPLLDADPTLGYESSNHYFFVRGDLIEKIINLKWILGNLPSESQ